MTPRAAWLTVSLAANLVLAGLVLGHSSKPAPQAVPHPSSVPGEKASTTPRQYPTTRPTVSTPVTSPAANGSQFNWAHLESEDYKQYIAALRAFGVPERTVRDLIIADVTKLYRPKLAALRGQKTSKTNFWENRLNFGGRMEGQTKEQRRQTAELQKEQTDLIKSLLGQNVYREMAKDSGQPDWTERLYGSLPDDLRDKVGEIQNRYSQARQELYANMDGYVDQDTQNDEKVLRRKFRQEMAAILTPQQLEQYELRSSDIANQMRWELAGFVPDEKEFRAIFNYKQAVEDLQTAAPADDSTPVSAEDRKLQTEKQKALETQLKEQLGDRYKEYEMLQNWEYRNLAEAGVPRESLLQIAGIKQQAQDAASKLRQDQNLSADDRSAALRAVRAETEKQLATLLGERRAKAYAGNGGFWIRNLGPRN